MTAKISIGVLLFIIWGFTFFVTIYLYLNDFNAETVDIVYFAIGGILAGGFFIIRSVFIEVPEPKTEHYTIAFLYEAPTGGFSPLSGGLSPLEGRQIFSDDLRGIRTLDSYRHAEAFQGLEVWDSLKGDGVLGLGAGHNFEAEKALTSLTEHAILTWLGTNLDLTVGYREGHQIQLITGGGQSAAIDLSLAPVKPEPIGEEWNPFFKEKPISISLPKGSKILRRRKGYYGKDIEIHTPCSKITFDINEGLATNPFGPPLGELGTFLRHAYNLRSDTEGLIVVGFSVNITTQAKTFRRFSDQAEVEKRWRKTIHEKFYRDFSWEYLRSHYLKKIERLKAG